MKNFYEVKVKETIEFETPKGDIKEKDITSKHLMEADSIVEAIVKVYEGIYNNDSNVRVIFASEKHYDEVTLKKETE
jgi:hypothetical protein